MLSQVKNEKEFRKVNALIDDAFKDPFFKDAFSIEYVPGRGLSEEVNVIMLTSTNSSGEIVGCFICNHYVNVNKITGITMFNFKKNPSSTYSRDIITFFSYMFDTLKVHKVNWTTNVGSASEKFQDKIVNEYNGRIVGIYKDDVLAADGRFYDTKEYEIMRSDYLKHEFDKEERKKNVRDYKR